MPAYLADVPAEYLPQAVDPNVMNAVSQLKIYKPGAKPVMTYKPEPPAPKTGILDNILNFVDKTVDKGTTILDKVGQAKAKVDLIKTRANTGWQQWQTGYENNIVNTPRYTGDDWITGIPNGVVIVAGLAIVGLGIFAMSRKGE